MAYKTLQLRRDTAAAWTSNNPTLLVGEPGFETDAGKLAIGDGITAWNDLDYIDSYIDHNALTNYVADKHIAHTGVSISAGTGLTGGGDISATRTLSLSHLGIQSLADPDADRILFWDESAPNACKWLACGNSIAITNTTIDTIQDIRTTAGPTFDHAHIGLADQGYGELLDVGGHIFLKGTSPTVYVAKDGTSYLAFQYETAVKRALLNCYTDNEYGPLIIQASQVGVDIWYSAAITGKFHIDQGSTTGAKPVLTLDQGDVSEEFIRFVGTAASGVKTQSIVKAADATATIAGYLKVFAQDDGDQIADQAYYLAIYTLA